MYNFKYKDQEPEETIKFCKKILSSLGFNIQEEIVEVSKSLYTVNLIDSVSGMFSNGKGVTREYALASGYAEFLERIQNALFVTGWNTEYEDFEYYPDEYTLNISEILKNTDILKDAEYLFVISNNRYPYNIEELISFLKLLNNNEDIFKVADFYSLSKKTLTSIPLEFLKKAVFTTGMCAGNSREEAISQGLFEICERWVNSYCWSNNLTPPEVPRQYIQKKYPNQYEEILEIEQLNPNAKIYVYDYSLGDSVQLPVVAILYIDQKLQRFRMQFGSHLRFEIALERCLTELVQGYDCKNETKNINNLTTLDWELTGNWGSRENKHKLLDFSIGKVPFYIFTSPPSWDFSPWTEYADYESKEAFNIIRDRILRITSDIYIRDNSYLGFNTYYIYVPMLSILPISKNIPSSSLDVFEEKVFAFPDSYLGMTDEEKKQFCLGLIDRQDAYTYCDDRIKDPSFLFKIAVLLENGYLEEAYNLKIFFPRYSKYEIVFEDIRLSLLGINLEQRKRCLQKFFTNETYSYWLKFFAYRNNIVSSLVDYNYEGLGLIEEKDMEVLEYPLNLVKKIAKENVKVQSDLSTLGG